jgi:hypothetical protein
VDLNLHQSDVKPLYWMKVLISGVSVCGRIFSPVAEFLGRTGPGVLAGSGSSDTLSRSIAVTGSWDSDAGVIGSKWRNSVL